MSVEGDPQGAVDNYFGRTAEYWRDVYGAEGLQGAVYRQRMETALRWTGELGLPPDASALEVGAGAGLAALGLAERGLQVTATDSSPEMVTTAQATAERAGLASRLEVVQADVHALPFPTERFELVLALGLLPWLHDPGAGVREIARVLAPGGWAVLSADNRLRLNFLTEPRENPLLAPLRSLRRALRARNEEFDPGPEWHLHSPRAVDSMLVDAGLSVERRATIGYGPFTVMGRPLLADPLAARTHVRLARLSAQRVPLLRRMGWHYLVAARKR